MWGWRVVVRESSAARKASVEQWCRFTVLRARRWGDSDRTSRRKIRDQSLHSCDVQGFQFRYEWMEELVWIHFYLSTRICFLRQGRMCKPFVRFWASPWWRFLYQSRTTPRWMPSSPRAKAAQCHSQFKLFCMRSPLADKPKAGRYVRPIHLSIYVHVTRVAERGRWLRCGDVTGIANGSIPSASGWTSSMLTIVLPSSSNISSTSLLLFSRSRTILSVSSCYSSYCGVTFSGGSACWLQSSMTCPSRCRKLVIKGVRLASWSDIESRHMDIALLFYFTFAIRQGKHLHAVDTVDETITSLWEHWTPAETIWKSL